jgi:hypothetical protein
MANNLQLADNSVNVEADALSDLLDNGYLRIYDAPQPASAGVAISTQTLLAELRFNATAAPSAALGVLTMGAFTADSSADATGTAAWFRALKSDGSTVVFDGEVGTSGSDLNLNTVAIVISATVSVTSMTYTVTK